VLKLLKSSKKVFIVEENEPVIELQVRDLAQREGLKVEIYGRHKNSLIEPYGELTHENVRSAIAKFFGVKMKENELKKRGALKKRTSWR